MYWTASYHTKRPVWKIGRMVGQVVLEDRTLITLNTCCVRQKKVNKITENTVLWFSILVDSLTPPLKKEQYIPHTHTHTHIAPYFSSHIPPSTCQSRTPHHGGPLTPCWLNLFAIKAGQKLLRLAVTPPWIDLPGPWGLGGTALLVRSELGFMEPGLGKSWAGVSS